MNRLQLILSSPHTTWAGVIYFTMKTAMLAGAIWIPDKAQQFKATAELIEAAAVGYGFFMAGDAAQSVSKNDVTASPK